MHDVVPVKGYRPQSESAVQVVNTNKELEEMILQRLDMLAQAPEIDPRWLNIGRTHIEQAFMAINRAVFKPERLKS